MQVTLVMFKADGTRRDFPVEKDRVVVGRKNNCDLRIPLSSVSRQHCEIRIEDDHAHLRDLGSSNGTYHNSIRVQEAPLGAGDEVVIGPVVFTVQIDGDPESIEPVRTVVSPEEDTGQSPTLSDSSAEDDQDETPQAIDTVHQEEHMPDIEPEYASPTVDLDDPIAALERLADAERAAANTASGLDFQLEEDADDQKH